MNVKVPLKCEKNANRMPVPMPSKACSSPENFNSTKICLNDFFTNTYRYHSSSSAPYPFQSFLILQLLHDQTLYRMPFVQDYFRLCNLCSILGISQLSGNFK